MQACIQERGALLAGAVQPNSVEAVTPAVPDGHLFLRPAVGDRQYVALTALVVAAVVQRCPGDCNSNAYSQSRMTSTLAASEAWYCDAARRFMGTGA